LEYNGVPSSIEEGTICIKASCV